MILLCKSIFALLAFYIVFSECIELPQIVKKNKNLVYLLIGGLYLYSHQNDKIEGAGPGDSSTLPSIVVICLWCLFIGYGMSDWSWKKWFLGFFLSACLTALLIWSWS